MLWAQAWKPGSQHAGVPSVQVTWCLQAVPETPSVPGVGELGWRREWLLTPVFWPGEYNPWNLKESDMIEGLTLNTYLSRELGSATLYRSFVTS